MNNSINQSSEKANPQPKKLSLSRLWTILAISLALGWCSSPQEKIHKLESEIAALEHTLITESKHYDDVTRQQNIQIDLREEWADPSINQEIGYATERAQSYDSKIEKTKKKLAKKQRKLNNLQEKYSIEVTWNSMQWRLKPGKYEYIIEEYNRSRGN